ncbi:hypothetical protein [Dokdonella sp.]|uniref:hypothetical protein n=1 Tax=Dokdonella sp. TaxID=2291710 RepID=UPI0025BFEE23|nr:hypothetical protein [Dokdonella sp.]MBX3690227.1 hypothetical protein [Dokdonella sp.]
MAEAKPRRRRWPVVLALLLVIGALGLFALSRLLRPDRVSALLTEQARGMGLELAIGNAAQYRFVPQLEIVLPASRLRISGHATPLLSIGALRARAPWRSLLGGPVRIDELVIEKAVLDLDELRLWRASRPTNKAAMPDLRMQLRVIDARVQAGDQLISDGIDADLGSAQDLSAWLARWSPAQPSAELLPPLTGTLEARSIDYGKTHIEGLQVELGDEPANKHR